MTGNPHSGEVEITLDRKRIMVLNLKALATAERIGEFSIFAIHQKPLGANEYRALGYAGLLKDDPRLTLEQFDEMINSEDRFVALVAAVMDAFDHAFGKSKEEPAQNPPNPAGGQSSSTAPATLE